MGLDSPDMFSAYRQFINGIIDFGVSPDQVTLSLETPVDIFLRNAWWPHRFNEESCSRVADISIDLIDNGATFSEEAIDGTCARIDVGAMCGVSTLQSSLLIIKEIGNRDGGMEGKGYINIYYRNYNKLNGFRFFDKRDCERSVHSVGKSAS